MPYTIDASPDTADTAEQLAQRATELLTEMLDGIDRTAITPEVFKFYAYHATKTKENVDQLAAEIHERQDKMRKINDLICEINNLTDQNNALDLSNNLELQEKLQEAKELGANINVNQLKFSPVERDRLIQNLHLKADEWDKTNRTQIQKMEIHVKELDRIMMMIKEVQKGENRPRQAASQAIKGG